jgi:phosphate transport system substrate-binding protein
MCLWSSVHQLRLAALVSLSLLGACGAPDGSAVGGASLTGQLLITGSSTIAPVMAEIASSFEQAYPGAQIDIQAVGSRQGIADVRSGLADIGMVSRELADDEQDLLNWTFAYDGVSLIVHASNPVDALTGPQVIDIYTGRIKSWRELGGSDSPIVVVNAAEGRGTLDVFLDYFRLDVRAIQADAVVGDDEQGITLVSGSPTAIGYVAIGTAAADIAASVPIKLLSVDGVEATPERVADGSFPVARPLNLVMAFEPRRGLAAAFIDYLYSDAGRAILEEQYFVPADR